MAARFLSRMFDPRRFVKGLSIVLAVAVAVGAAPAVASGFARMSAYVQPDRTASPAVRANAKAHVIFASPRDGDLDVYAASADGRRRAALTRNGEDDFIREVAADGRVLVDRIMGGVVAVVSADGRRERRFAGDVATFALGGRALVLGTEDYQMFLVPLA